MKKDSRKVVPVSNRNAIRSYDAILSEVVDLLKSARRTSARTVNTIMTATYWEIGRRIVEWEQSGKKRAAYGEALLNRLAADLTKRFGRGFSRQNLQQMRQFYLVYPTEKICQTASGQLDNKNQSQIFQTPSGKSDLNLLTKRFPLPWSHYVCLLSVKIPDARAFYETEALRGGWSVRQLERQIAMNALPFLKTRSLCSKKGLNHAPKMPLRQKRRLKTLLCWNF